ncbi:hypothetical protein B0H11DRAFT_2245241 [Mycena galericulata]|nr:hypothetical protein B0H11DRAFT_2245241 [Mycena galericulata]
MAPRSWATDEQDVWLRTRMGRYLEAVAQKQVSKFWILLEQEWASAWLTADSDALDIETHWISGTLRRRLRNWYRQQRRRLLAAR